MLWSIDWLSQYGLIRIFSVLEAEENPIFACEISLKRCRTKWKKELQEVYIFYNSLPYVNIINDHVAESSWHLLLSFFTDAIYA